MREREQESEKEEGGERKEIIEPALSE